MAFHAFAISVDIPVLVVSPLVQDCISYVINLLYYDRFGSSTIVCKDNAYPK